MNYPTSARFDKQIRFIYKWLPIFCGCHQRPERSFFVRGYQMPVCARCEGELIGILAALIAIWFVRPVWWLMALIMVPMIVDGLIQALTEYESNNWRRLITGLLFGFGITMLFFFATIALFKFGVGLGIRLRG
ncbi:MAG: DUF2085 domain-containing protein [Clostridiales bacterium]|nr:DUF2085 domain-containing protein [Clostridiales bacterium]